MRGPISPSITFLAIASFLSPGRLRRQVARLDQELAQRARALRLPRPRRCPLTREVPVRHAADRRATAPLLVAALRAPTHALGRGTQPLSRAKRREATGGPVARTAQTRPSHARRHPARTTPRPARPEGLCRPSSPRPATEQHLAGRCSLALALPSRAALARVLRCRRHIRGRGAGAEPARAGRQPRTGIPRHRLGEQGQSNPPVDTRGARLPRPHDR